MYKVREKYLWIEPHAYEGMVAERPAIQLEHVYEAIQSPDKVVLERKARVKAMKWIGKRTIIVYYDEYEEDIHVRGVSATRRKLV